MSAADGAGPLLLALDLGTGSCRAVIFDDNGQQLASSSREYTHRSLPGVPGSQIFDTELVWSLLVGCIRQAVNESARPAAVAAIATASMREGMVLWDRNGREIWACPNVDSRAGSEAADLVRSGAAARIFEIAGDWVSITAPARFAWLAAHQPEVLSTTAHVGMLGDWVTTRLTGEFVTDPSLGSSSGMFDLARRTWSEEILELCGVDADWFPPVLEPGRIAGRLRPDVATDLGLLAGIPVVVGGADTQLALAGLGIAESGRLTLVGGSFWQTTLVSDRAEIDAGARLRTLCHAAPNQWMIEGIGFYCGLAMRWFRDSFCDHEIAVAATTGADPYELLETQAAGVPPGSNGTVAVLSNLMQASRWVHAAPAFVGFDLTDPSCSGRAACVRAIEEAAAFTAHGHRLILEEVRGAPVHELVFTGGAAKGTLWARIVCDVLGLPTRVPVIKESTALGAALFAGKGAGLWDDACSKARSVVAFEQTLEPNPTAHSRYRDLYQRWLEIYHHQLALAEARLTEPLWWAAGVDEAAARPGQSNQHPVATT